MRLAHVILVAVARAICGVDAAFVRPRATVHEYSCSDRLLLYVFKQLIFIPFFHRFILGDQRLDGVRLGALALRASV